MLLSYNSFISKFDDMHNLQIISKMYEVLELNHIKLLMINKDEKFDEKFILVLLQIIKADRNQSLNQEVSIKILKSFRTMYSLDLIKSN